MCWCYSGAEDTTLNNVKMVLILTSLIVEERDNKATNK